MTPAADLPDGQISKRFGCATALAADPNAAKCLARRNEFRQLIQRDLGRPDRTRKIIRFSFSEIGVLFASSRLIEEGRTRRHDTWSGLRWTQQRCARERSQGGESCERSIRARRAALRRTAKPCGPGTRCWCQALRRWKSPNRVDSRRQFARRRRQKEFVSGESAA